MTGTLLARWEAGYKTGWVVLTDLAPEVGQLAWYALRAGLKPISRIPSVGDGSGKRRGCGIQRR